MTVPPVIPAVAPGEFLPAARRALTRGGIGAMITDTCIEVASPRVFGMRTRTRAQATAKRKRPQGSESRRSGPFEEQVKEQRRGFTRRCGTWAGNRDMKQRSKSSGASTRKRRVQEWRQRLMEARRRALEDLGLPASSSRAVADLADAAEVEMDALYELRDMRSSTLGEIDRAIERLERGLYGACESCGKPIGEARLRALPFASMCLACKQKEENEGGRPSWSAPSVRWRDMETNGGHPDGDRESHDDDKSLAAGDTDL